MFKILVPIIGTFAVCYLIYFYNYETQSHLNSDVNFIKQTKLTHNLLFMATKF